MKIQYCLENYASIDCDLLAYPVFSEDDSGRHAAKHPASLDKIIQKAVGNLLASKEFKPELHETCKIHQPSGLKAKRLLLVGAGKKSDFTPAKLRDVAGTAVRAARSGFCKEIAFVCPSDPVAGLAARLTAEGAAYANYDADL